MFDVKDFLERALTQQRNLLKIYEKRIRDLPEGTLSVYRKNGKDYYLKYENGVRTYLGNEEAEVVQELKLRKHLFDMSSRIKNNEILMLDFLDKYQDPSPAVVEQNLGPAYQFRQKNLMIAQKRKRDEDWGAQPYKRSDHHPETLTHKTLKGDLVRSKSEVIIANTYFAKGIQYRYEELIEVGNKIYAPDFRVLVPRQNKIKMHEHFGMMNDWEYRQNAMRKIEQYIASGYKPYEDIIFTFDDLGGNIDAQALDLLITNFLI